LELVEATVTNPAEVLDAAKALVSRGAQAFLNAGDNTLSVGFDSFVKVARENGLPVFAGDVGSLERGALITVGPDYYQTGYDGGVCLSRILRGENIADVPIHQTSDSAFAINLDTARKGGFDISDDLLARASMVLDSREKSRGKVGEFGKVP
jgi:putative ABC transport system substrate-binding protein